MQAFSILLRNLNLHTAQWVLLILVGVSMVGCANENQLIELELRRIDENDLALVILSTKPNVGGVLELEVSLPAGNVIWHVRTNYWRKGSILLGDEKSPFVRQVLYSFSFDEHLVDTTWLSLKFTIQYDGPRSANAMTLTRRVRIIPDEGTQSPSEGP